MGNRQNLQRAAIVALAGGDGCRPPSGMERASLFLESGEELVFAGVSGPQQTSNGIYPGDRDEQMIGVNFRQASEEPRTVSLSRPSEEYAYVVLARGVTDHEKAWFYRRHNWMPCVAAVELLRFVREDERNGKPRLVFARTGLVEVYINIL